MILFQPSFLLLTVFLLLALAGCTQATYPCPDPAGCFVIQSQETIQFGVIAPLSGDRSCPETRNILKNLNQVISNKKIKGHSLALSIWDTYSTDESMESALVEFFSQPTLIAVLVLQCQDKAQEEPSNPWIKNVYPLLTEPSHLIEGIAHLDSLVVLKGNDLIIPRGAWRMSIIGDQVLNGDE